MAAEQKKSVNSKHLMWWVTVVLVILIGFITFLRHTRLHPSTDDAYINANVVHIAARVSGRVTAVYVENYQFVRKGQPLFQIDPQPYQIAVNAAQAKFDLSEQGEKSEVAQVKEAEAAVTERQADVLLARNDAQRILTLVQKGQMSKQAGDQVRNRLQVSQASLLAAENSLAKAKANLGAADNSNANIRAAKADLDQAKLNLSYTLITAPADGNLVNFNVRTGNMIQASQPLFDLVENGQYWVDANYKETQLERIKLGQPAIITTDIYPDKKFTGVVYKISPGSGTAFAILPAENATGNWVKVTQRVPVKVLILNRDKNHPLPVGTSATITIDTTQ